jgi:hypothetical protein
MSSVALPSDLVKPIVEHLCNDSMALRSTALVASDWLEPSRKHLFQRFTIPRNNDNEVDYPFAASRNVTNSARIATVRLVWLLVHPTLAAYVTEIQVYTKQMEGLMSTGPPGADTFYLLLKSMANRNPIFQNVQELRIVDEGRQVGYQMWLGALSDRFPHLQTLEVQLRSRMPGIINTKYTFGLRHLSISSSESSGVRYLLQTLVLGATRRTLEKVHISLRDDITSEGLCLSISLLGFFLHLKEAKVRIRLDKDVAIHFIENQDLQMSQHVFKLAEDTVKGLRLAPFAPKMGSHPTLPTLELSIVGNETCIPLLVFILHGAELPALRNLRIVIDVAPCVTLGDSPRAEFRPYAHTMNAHHNLTWARNDGQQIQGANPHPPILSRSLVQALEHFELVFSSPKDVHDVYIHDSAAFLALLEGSNVLENLDILRECSNGHVHLIN